MANNTLKYRRIDPTQREALRADWNPPVVWPVILLMAGAAVLLVSGIAVYRRRERSTAL
jgi:hypothetical protein